MIELLPLPVWPTRATVLPGLGGEVDVVQDEAGRVVAEGDTPELDPRAAGARAAPARPRVGEVCGARGVLPVGRHVDQPEDPLRARHGEQPLVVLVADDR